MTPTTRERQTAYLTSIGTLLSDKEFNRVHIIAVLVSLGEGSASEGILDDGTGKITARSFEIPDFFARFQLGDILRVIGKVRTFNEQVYLIPELAKKITNKQLIALHKLQLRLYEKYKKTGVHNAVSEPEGDSSEEHPASSSAPLEEIPVDADDTAPSSPLDSILSLIRLLDTGEGAHTEQIIEKAGEQSERFLQQLLEDGEIFEIKPGRIKVLD